MLPKLLAAIEATRFQAINRLIGAKMAREIHVTPKHSAARAVHEKQRRTRAARLNFHQRSSRQRGTFLNFFTDDRRQLFNRGRLKNGGHAQPPPKNFFDLRNQFDGQQRMAAEIKKFVLDADRDERPKRFPKFR